MWNPFRKEPKPLRMPLFNGHNEQDVIDAVSSMFRGMGVRPRVNPVEDYVIWFDWKNELFLFQIAAANCKRRRVGGFNGTTDWNLHKIDHEKMDEERRIFGRELNPGAISCIPLIEQEDWNGHMNGKMEAAVKIFTGELTISDEEVEQLRSDSMCKFLAGFLDR